IALAGNRQSAVRSGDGGICAQLVESDERARLIVEIVELIVRPDGAHGAVGSKRANLSGGRYGCHHAELLKGVAAVDADAAQHIKVRSVQAVARLKSDDDDADAVCVRQSGEL